MVRNMHTAGHDSKAGQEGRDFKLRHYPWAPSLGGAEYAAKGRRDSID